MTEYMQQSGLSPHLKKCMHICNVAHTTSVSICLIVNLIMAMHITLQTTTLIR